jgi:hypothetical protein
MFRGDMPGLEELINKINPRAFCGCGRLVGLCFLFERVNPPVSGTLLFPQCIDAKLLCSSREKNNKARLLQPDPGGLEFRVELTIHTTSECIVKIYLVLNAHMNVKSSMILNSIKSLAYRIKFEF